MKKQVPMTIGVLANEASVGVETIRFYERKGLINQPEKIGGFRHYQLDDVRRIRLIKKLQEIGFSLEEIKDFLAYESCCGESKKLIQEKSRAKIIEIKQKLSDLTIALGALEKFMSTCGSNKHTSPECELLDCFENNWECCADDNTELNINTR